MDIQVRLFRGRVRSHFSIIILAAGLLCLWSSQAMAQAATPDKEITDTPSFIVDLVEKTELKQEQVEQMRSGGAGWGNIMISARLAERIAADSEGALTFDEALEGVLKSRAEGKGFGQIAHENDLKLGRVLGDEETPDATNPPPFIVDLVEKTELTQEQVEQMRSGGAGWGNIMISTRLAERIAADSEGVLTFDDALAGVLKSRTEKKGFGQIAHENDLKLGRVLGGEDGTANATNQPPFIADLVEKSELTPEQVEQMRSGGAGWGNIMISTRLAERIAADSEGLLTFDEALAGVLKSRAEGKGFGQIAHENDLKLGRVVGGGNDGTPDGSNPPPFIADLVEKTELTPEQVEQMRIGGAGWGNIMISTRLAERIAADSEGVLTFDEALEGVLESRAEDKGFGEIAALSEKAVTKQLLLRRLPGQKKPAPIRI
ncbi:MAG: hypothetical protein ACYSU5_14855 [Planctomycetota bacterium]